MLQNLITCIIIGVNTYFSHAFVTMAVPIRHKYLYPATATLAIQLVWLYNFCVRETPSVALANANLLIGVFILLCYAPSDQKLRSLLAHAGLMVTQLTIGLVLSVLMVPFGKLTGIDPIRLTTHTDPLYPYACLNCTVWCVIGMYFCGRLLRKHLPVFGEEKYVVWLAVIPFSQLLAAVLIWSIYFDGFRFKGIGAGILLCFVFFLAADVICVIIIRKMREVTILETNYRHAKRHLEDQVAYYQEMQKNILAVNQTRHDLNNQLQAAYYLLEHGDREDVRKQLDLLRGQISRKVGAHYCENLIVDAVLTEKAQKCADAGISLSICALLPGDLPIETAHLCSIFSNLLDNSIHAVEQLPQPQQKISLYTDIQKGVLMVRCVNPAEKPRKKVSRDPMRLHGLGLDILKQIAAIYGGRLQTTWEDGRFTALIMLPLSPVKETAEPAGKAAEPVPSRS